MSEKANAYLIISSNLNTAHGVTFVKYASILLQSITVRLDEDFLMEVIDLTKVKGAWEGLSEEYVEQFKITCLTSFCVQYFDQGTG